MTRIGRVLSAMSGLELTQAEVDEIVTAARARLRVERRPSIPKLDLLESPVSVLAPARSIEQALQIQASAQQLGYSGRLVRGDFGMFVLWPMDQIDAGEYVAQRLREQLQGLAEISVHIRVDALRVPEDS